MTTWVCPSSAIVVIRVPVATWYSGVVVRNTSSWVRCWASAMVTALKVRACWLRQTPFGRPVVPLV